MLKRTLVFSNSVNLTLKNMQLVISFKEIESLPVTTKQERKDAALFRKNLEKDGFAMHQFSVYMRFCASLESAQVHIKRVRNFAPDVGHITVLSITDKQYSNIINIWGKIEKKSKPSPIQLEFF